MVISVQHICKTQFRSSFSHVFTQVKWIQLWRGWFQFRHKLARRPHYSDWITKLFPLLLNTLVSKFILKHIPRMIMDIETVSNIIWWTEEMKGSQAWYNPTANIKPSEWVSEWVSVWAFRLSCLMLWWLINSVLVKLSESLFNTPLFKSASHVMLKGQVKIVLFCCFSTGIFMQWYNNLRNHSFFLPA